MNSDPFDSAAWRTFNMLDADETAIFNQAMLHDPALRSAFREMERLSAAIAAATTLPIDPAAGQLERLQARLGHGPPKSAQFWLAVSGWATAAVLAIVLALHLTGIIGRRDASLTVSSNNPSAAGNPAGGTARADSSHPNTPAISNPAHPLPDPALARNPVTGKEPTAKAETKRLNQEIEVLRENLEKFQNRDRVLFEVVPGMALPIVMTMTPPGMAAEDPAIFAKNDEHSPLTSLLGDALTTLTGGSAATPENHPNTPPAPAPMALPEHPTAIPIYDAARDSGTLVVSNLPPAAEGDAYHLWVTTQTGERPFYVGTLPESSAAGADSFDFSLGSTMVLPSGFLLTRDPQNAPATPTKANTVLQGPPTPTR